MAAISAEARPTLPTLDRWAAVVQNTMPRRDVPPEDNIRAAAFWMRCPLQNRFLGSSRGSSFAVPLIRSKGWVLDPVGQRDICRRTKESPGPTSENRRGVGLPASNLATPSGTAARLLEADAHVHVPHLSSRPQRFSAARRPNMTTSFPQASSDPQYSTVARPVAV